VDPALVTIQEGSASCEPVGESASEENVEYPILRRTVRAAVKSVLNSDEQEGLWRDLVPVYRRVSACGLAEFGEVELRNVIFNGSREELEQTGRLARMLELSQEVESAVVRYRAAAESVSWVAWYLNVRLVTNESKFSRGLSPFYCVGIESLSL
jgi:hypothetical protein